MRGVTADELHRPEFQIKGKKVKVSVERMPEVLAKQRRMRELRDTMSLIFQGKMLKNVKLDTVGWWTFYSGWLYSEAHIRWNEPALPKRLGFGRNGNSSHCEDGEVRSAAVTYDELFQLQRMYPTRPQIVFELSFCRPE